MVSINGRLHRRLDVFFDVASLLIESHGNVSFHIGVDNKREVHSKPDMQKIAMFVGVVIREVAHLYVSLCYYQW